MLVDPRYELGYVRGDHEPWLNDWLEQWLRPGDTVVDVGAHVGYFSVCGAAVVGPTGRVIAYEPDPDNYARLLRNLDRNDLTGIVETMRTAISDSHGERHFRRATSQSSRVEGRLAQAVDTSAEFILVAVHRLDDLLQHVQPHVIKVDVEGGEGEVLRGASRILQDRQTRWIIEVHNDMARQQVMEILSRAGYGVRLFRPVHPVYPDYRQEYAIAETD